MKRMKLLTKELEARFAQFGRQEALGDRAVVVAKFLTPDAQWTWWATEYDPESREFFGLVQGFGSSWGISRSTSSRAPSAPLGSPSSATSSGRSRRSGKCADRWRRG